MNLASPLRAVVFAAGVALPALWALTAPAQDADAPTGVTPSLLFSYEALAFDPLGLDSATASYDDRVAFTEQVLETEIPRILEILDIPPEAVETQVTPGGYLLETNASLQSSFEADERTADLFAAAVGYVFRQWSILVTDFTPEGEGDTGYAVVTFLNGEAPSGPEAQAFFEHAASVDEGLGGGYTAFGADLFFLNVTDGAGNPYSGLDDEAFIAALTEAAESYTEADVAVTLSGRADARFVENDWSSASEGEQYAEILGADLAEALLALRVEHEEALLAAADAFGWR